MFLLLLTVVISKNKNFLTFYSEETVGWGKKKLKVKFYKDVNRAKFVCCRETSRTSSKPPPKLMRNFSGIFWVVFAE